MGHEDSFEGSVHKTEAERRGGAATTTLMGILESKKESLNYGFRFLVDDLDKITIELSVPSELSRLSKFAIRTQMNLKGFSDVDIKYIVKE